eukprot:TRINITY_DN80649_c0_g1_i1.p1 TRINITY_DN80649_c0_g1~~TRINITY_DN80649_c0_g1_i1.p1  ORF type:complete len:150 (+),score=18.36 TRINITY_DN80649_c0_g1_i1:193-642(+)
MGRWYEIERTNKLNVILGMVTMVVSLLVLLMAFVLIALAGGLPNDQFPIYQILQWVFALSGLVFWIFGVLGGFKANVPCLVAFIVYNVIVIIWNIIYIAGLGAVAPVANKSAQIPVALLMIIVSIVCSVVPLILVLRIADYKRKIMMNS